MENRDSGNAPPVSQKTNKESETKMGMNEAEIRAELRKSEIGQKGGNGGDEVALPLSLRKALRRKSDTGIGSNSSNEGSSSNEGGSGNNSDNSALVSLGNNSFGFNFDSEEGLLNSSSPSKSRRRRARRAAVPSEVQTNAGQQEPINLSIPNTLSLIGNESGNDRGIETTSDVSSLTTVELASDSKDTTTSNAHETAAAIAVADLRSIASANARPFVPSNPKPIQAVLPERHLNHHQAKKATPKVKKVSGKKRKAVPSGLGNGSGGYNSDDECDPNSIAAHTSRPQQCPEITPSSSLVPSFGHLANGMSSTHSVGSLDSMNPKNGLNPDVSDKREERNAREKERSFRISRQINELRNLLSSGGVIVPKGTKSSVLSEAANYIRMLQQHQYRSEIDRHNLIQQIQMIGGGSMGPEAGKAVRHSSAQNGVWSLGNFGGVPPKSAMTCYEPGKSEITENAVAPSQSRDNKENEAAPQIVTVVEEHEYRHIFNASPLGMAIASMGGAFIDCNELFCSLSSYTKQEICSMTIFNLTSRSDLQPAFDLISQMISPPAGGAGINASPCVLRGAMKDRDDLGLSVALVKGEDGSTKSFSVTLIQNPASPFDPSEPKPATADLIKNMNTTKLPQCTKESGSGAITTEPAYTTG